MMKGSEFKFHAANCVCLSIWCRYFLCLFQSCYKPCIHLFAHFFFIQFFLFSSFIHGSFSLAIVNWPLLLYTPQYITLDKYVYVLIFLYLQNWFVLLFIYSCWFHKMCRFHRISFLISSTLTSFWLHHCKPRCQNKFKIQFSIEL